MTSAMGSPKAVKAVKFHYKATPQTAELLGTFRRMVNDAIHICLEEGIKGRLKLRNRIYHEFQEKYGVISCFPYSVAEVAWSIVKKHRRWQRKPFAKRPMAKIEAQAYSLNHGLLSLPFKKEGRIFIPLEYGNYQRSFLTDETLKRGSVTINPFAAIVTFSKTILPIGPTSRVGYDLNEKSIVSSEGAKIDLSEVARLHTEYGVRRSEFYLKHANDRRIKLKFANSRREKERVKQFLHLVAKEIVNKAKGNNQALVLERLNGIRYSHRRGTVEGKGTRRRISLWPFKILQDYITYNAAWEGVPFECVNPSGTSQTCHACGFINRKLKLTEREWRCPSCGAILDRDLNAAINIERRGKIPCLGEVRPGAQGTDEAVKGNPTIPVILQAEALKLGSRDGVPTTSRNHT
jgi:IS605 OrfB family transposase